MLFARYIGPDKPGENFVEGKVYVSESSFSDGETVDLSVVRVRDEDGLLIEVDQEEERFVYLEQNYAAVVNPFDEFEPGDVVTVSGVSDDRKMYDVVGYGYRSAGDLVLLDRTNVCPRMMVLHESKWNSVRAVDESLSVMVEDGEGLIDIQGVRLAVSDGDVMSIPLATCIETGRARLTKGKRYRLLGLEDDECVLKDDDGDEIRVPMEWLKLG